MVADALHRPLQDLRISVTDRCNFRCRYCMPPEIFGNDYPFLTPDKLLSFDEIVRLCTIFAALGVRKVRITGGEPLLRKDLPALIKRIWTIPGIEDIGLTTNGVLLPNLADKLAEAGLKRVTVSLDSLDEARFGHMNGRGISPDAVVKGIDAASRAGLQVKVNMVVQKGANDEDILPMAHFFKQKGHTLRFIEFMDVGNTNGWKMDQVVSKEEILRHIHQELPLAPADPHQKSDVAKRFVYQDGTGEIGIISSVTDAFCSSCTRARLSADGKLYNCLFAEQGTDLVSHLRARESDEMIKDLIEGTWTARHDRYSEERLSQTAPGKKKIEMSYIGG